jgi:hypothetical protein
MKDYIVTVEETYFDATKFEIGGFYMVVYKGEKGEEFKCILTSVTKDKVTLRYYDKKGYNKDLIIMPFEIESGKYEIKEIKTKGIYKVLNTETDEVVPLSKAKTKYWDLYRKDAEMKVGKCYEIKIGERVFKGFCSHKDSIDIIMVLYSDTGTIGAISYEFTACSKWNDKIIYESLTHGAVVRINRSELKEGKVYFKELI